MTKSKTPYGYLCIENEVIAEHAQPSIERMFQEKDLNEIVISSDDAKKFYRTENPFGCGYTNNYSRVIATHNATMKISAKNHVGEIDFIEIP